MSAEQVQLEAERLIGKFVARVPRSQHRKLQIVAKAEGVSMNSLVMAILAERVGEGERKQECEIVGWHDYQTEVLAEELREEALRREETAMTPKDREERKCYLCDTEILQIPGQEFKLRCEKGSPITVCEDCYEEAASEACDWETFK